MNTKANTDTIDKREAELLPCPFDGGKAELIRIGNDHTKSQRAVIRCTARGCGVEVRVGVIRQPYEWAVEKVIERWNTRSAGAELEAARQESGECRHSFILNEPDDTGAIDGAFYCVDCGVGFEAIDVLKALQRTRQEVARYWAALERMPKEVPTTWLDSLLSGPDKVLTTGDCREIESLLRAIQDRLRDIAKATLEGE